MCESTFTGKLSIFTQLFAFGAQSGWGFVNETMPPMIYVIFHPAHHTSNTFLAYDRMLLRFFTDSKVN